MPTRLTTNYPSLTDADEFELMIRDICALEWNDPHTERFGRTGQKQQGVDVYGKPIDLNGVYRAAQCKLRTKKEQLTEHEIGTEVSDARRFPHKLDTLIIATDAPRNTHTQILVDQISEREMSRGNFRVAIWFWDNITERLATYPKLIARYYPDFYASLTTLPIVEKLIDKPLQVVGLSAPLNLPLSIEEVLKFRGLRILDPNRLGFISKETAFDDILPDGIVCSYNLPVAETTDSILLKFAGKIQNHIQQVDNSCPVFVVLPSSLTTQFLQLFEKLDGDQKRIQILATEMSSNETADIIFDGVFYYGYTRRGGPATIDIAIRTRESRPNSILLDLDWQTRLSTSRFPTSIEWESSFVPALTAVRSQLLKQGDRTKIQINCQLPLPAAFAIGFTFNVRVARVGVWARKTEVSDFKHQFWLSDGNSADVKFIPEWLKQSSDDSQSAIVELTSYLTTHKAVESFIKESEIVPGAILQVKLEKDGNPMANIDESFAVAYANQVGQIIRHLNEQGITDIHLFARIPAPLAVLIGQRLFACGRIHLYWFDNPVYRFAFTLI
ncbi:MAG: SAVED domain-containing protein [Anaerolineales bacterium]|nr:SAVED domain-containing protein [Anaerolineales bacterium]